MQQPAFFIHERQPGKYPEIPDEDGLLCPQSGPPEPPAGPCTAPGSCPSPRVLGWPGSRCGRRRPPCRAASAEERRKKVKNLTISGQYEGFSSVSWI